MADITAGLGSLLSGLTGAFSGLLSGVKQQVKAAQETASSSQQLTKGFNRLLAVVEELSAHIRGVVLPVPTVTAAPGKGGPGGPGGPGGAGGASAGLEMGAVLAGVGAVVGALTALGNAAQQFVGALNPNLLEYFNQTIRDLQATLGYAFEPIIANATGLFQQIAGIVLPLMEQLRPVFESLANNAAKQLITQLRIVVTLFKVLTPLFNLFMKFQQLLGAIGQVIVMLIVGSLSPFIVALKILTPVIDFLSDVIQGVMEVVGAFGEVFEAVGVIFDVVTDMIKDAVASLFGGKDIKDAFKEFTKMIRTAITQLVLFTARLAMFFGLTGFVDKLKAALTPKRGLVAGGQTSITNIEQISKNLIESAAKATGAGGAKTEEDWRKETLEALNNMDAENIFEKFRPILDPMLGVLNAIKHGIYKLPGTGPEPPDLQLPRA